MPTLYEPVVFADREPDFKLGCVSALEAAGTVHVPRAITTIHDVIT